MSQLVAFRSRFNIYTIDFTADDSVGTDQIYIPDTAQVIEVTETNIATWSINSSSSIPISLTANSYAAITVTKTTPGSAAQLVIKTRKATDNSYTQAAVNYSIYQGRYIYMLTSVGNTVYKIDSNLLTPANYAGAGSWTVNPVVATISMPTVPNSGAWYGLVFVRQGGVNRVLVLGMSAANTYGCIIRESDDLVYDITNTTLNGVTTLTTTSSNHMTHLMRLPIYDYKNEYVFYFGSAYPQPGYRIDLSTNVVTLLGSESPSRYAYLQYKTNHDDASYNYVLDKFVGISYDFKITSASVYGTDIADGGVSSHKAWLAYSNRYYGFESSTAGNRVVQINPQTMAPISYGPTAVNDGTTGGSNSLGQTPLSEPNSVIRQIGVIARSLTNNAYGIYSNSANTYRVGRLQNVFAGQTVPSMIVPGYNSGNGVWVIGSNNVRLYICDHAQTPMNFGYLDMPYAPYAMVSNSLKI